MAASSEKLKQVNKQSIKDYFYEVKFSNKNQLAQATRISKTTCTTLIKELMEEGFLKQTENNESTGGRPSKGYELNKDFYHVCLIMIQNGQLPKIQFEIKNLWVTEVIRRVSRLINQDFVNFFNLAVLVHQSTDLVRMTNPFSITNISSIE